MNNRRDVQLVIRARAEGEKLVERLTDALLSLGEAENQLGDGAGRNESKLRSLAGAVSALAAVSGKLDTEANKGSAAIDRQRLALAALEAQLEAVRRQQSAGRQAVAGAESRLVDARLAGGSGDRQRAEIQGAKQALAELTAQEQKLANEIRTRQAALGESTLAFQGLASAANAADAALDKVGGADTTARIEAQADALRDQARAAEAVGAAAREAGLAEQDMAEKAARLKRAMDPLAAIQDKLKRDLREVRGLYRAGHLSAEELARAEAHLAREAKNASDQLSRIGRGERGKVAMFGLKPYELTNLGYQINDVFTQIASGTSVTQTLSQQGGQLLQLFPRLGASIVAALGNPAIVTAASAFGLVVAAVARLGDQQGRIRDFGGLLHSMGDGGEYSDEALSGAVTQMRRFGAATDEAENAVRRFVNAGVAPEYIDRFGRAAQNLSRIMSIDLAQASEMVAQGLTGNYDALLRLQDATHFLSNVEEQRIRQMFEEGRASEARTEAARIFFDRMESGARQAKGPWEQAWSSLKRSWDALLNSLANSGPIQFVLGLFNALADTLRGLVNVINFLTSPQSVHVMDGINAAILARLRQMREQVANNPAALAEIDRRIAALEAQLGQVSTGRGTGDTVNSAERQRLASRALGDVAFQRQIVDLQAQYEAAVTRSARARIQGEIEYRLALKETNNEQVAQARRRLAEQRELNRTRLVGERAIQFAIRRIIAVESGGNTNARNPRGSASGLGQFTDSTWLNRFRAYFPERAAAMTTRQILALKTNAEMGRRMTELFIRENARTLAQVGLEVNALNLYFMHFLGGGARGGGVRFLRAPGNTPIRQLVSAAAIRANPEYLGGAGATRDSVYARVGRRFGGADADNDGQLEAENAVLEEIARREEQRAEQQRQFNLQLDTELANRQRLAEQQRTLLGLSGDQAFAEQRRQAIENAVQEAQDRAAQQQITVDADRLARIREVAGLEWDITHARERATKAVDDASGERNALLERLRSAIEDGDAAAIEALQDRLRNVNERLDEAIQNAIRFWQQFDTPEAATAVAGLENLRRSIGRTTEDLRREIAQQPVDRLQALRRELQQQAEFAERAGNMEVGRALRRSIRDMDEELLRAIDHMIEFWGQSNRPEAAAMVAQFQNLRNEVLATHDQFRIFAGDIQQSFADTMVSSLDQFAQALAGGRNVIKSVWDLARGFAADFLRSLGMMLLRALALKAAMKLGFERVANGLNGILGVAPLYGAAVALNSAGGKLTEAGGALGTASLSWLFTAGMIMKAATMLASANISSAASGGGAGGPMSGIGGNPLGAFSFLSQLFHGGGIAGAGTQSRSVWPGVFAGFMRYHVGGIAGLRPGEIPAILERGEEILTRSNPRHILNGGAARSEAVEPKVDLQNIICMDPADWFSKGLNSRPGQRALVSFLQANSGVVKKALY